MAWIEDSRARFQGLFGAIQSSDFSVGEGWKAIIVDVCLDLDAMCIPR